MRIILMVMLCFGVLACNTVQGVGRDIESIGKAGEDIIDGE